MTAEAADQVKQQYSTVIEDENFKAACGRFKFSDPLDQFFVDNLECNKDLNEKLAINTRKLTEKLHDMEAKKTKLLQSTKEEIDSISSEIAALKKQL